MTAEDVARYLDQHPDFFDHHPELLARLVVTDPHAGRAVSLPERRAMLLRERVRALEARVVELVRHGQDNDTLVERLTDWTRAMLGARDRARLTVLAVEELRRAFEVPMAALRIWSADPELAGLPCAGPVGEDVVRLAASMRAPYCGANADFEAAAWMAADGALPASLAMIPLRAGEHQPCFGLLVLGSPDPGRFATGMGTAFLVRLGELAGAALAPDSLP